MREMVMMTVTGAEDAPSLEQSAAKLGVPSSALDPEFGVVLIDFKRHIYTVRVDAAYLPETPASTEGVAGPFSDPKIAPFGLPE